MLLLLLLRLEKGTEGREKKTAQTKKEDCIKEKNQKTNLKKKKYLPCFVFLAKGSGHLFHLLLFRRIQAVTHPIPQK